MKSVAIILAGGRGKRMNAAISKQYLSLYGKPVLSYAIEAFESSDIDEIILVTAKGEEDYCFNEIVQKYGYKKVINIVTGGSERFLSVYEGLKAIKKNDESFVVLIHDGARPFISKRLINSSIEGARNLKACVLGVPSKDTVKIVNNEKIIIDTPRRDDVYIIQTPQSFEFELIKKAYDYVIENGVSDVTDDAMVLEAYGYKDIKVIDGDYENIKITTAIDLEIGKIIIKNRKS